MSDREGASGEGGDLLLDDVMTPDTGVDANSLLADALREMRDKQYDQMSVRDAQFRPIGVITSLGLAVLGVGLLQARGDQVQVVDVMAPLADGMLATPDETLAEAFDRLLCCEFLVVTDSEQRICGIVTLYDAAEELQPGPV